MNNTPSLFRIIAMDLIDFIVVVSPATLLAWCSFLWYTANKGDVVLGIGPEVVLEAAFLVPTVAQIWFATSIMTSVVYQVVSLPLWQTTLGGRLMGIQVVTSSGSSDISVGQMILRGVGSSVFMLLFCVGPLYAWWLDAFGRGGGDYLAKTKPIRA